MAYRAYFNLSFREVRADKRVALWDGLRNQRRVPGVMFLGRLLPHTGYVLGNKYSDLVAEIKEDSNKDSFRSLPSRRRIPSKPYTNSLNIDSE